jgi:hypothetical protein
MEILDGGCSSSDGKRCFDYVVPWLNGLALVSWLLGFSFSDDKVCLDYVVACIDG